MVSPVSGSSTDLYSNFYNSDAFKKNEIEQGVHNLSESMKDQQEEWKKSQQEMTATLPSLNDSIS